MVTQGKADIEQLCSIKRYFYDYLYGYLTIVWKISEIVYLQPDRIELAY
jgi:hypothetical protein